MQVIRLIDEKLILLIYLIKYWQLDKELIMKIDYWC